MSSHTSSSSRDPPSTPANVNNISYIDAVSIDNQKSDVEELPVSSIDSRKSDVEELPVSVSVIKNVVGNGSKNMKISWLHRLQ